jgi:hypothetical protein
VPSTAVPPGPEAAQDRRTYALHRFTTRVPETVGVAGASITYRHLWARPGLGPKIGGFPPIGVNPRRRTVAPSQKPFSLHPLVPKTCTEPVSQTYSNPTMLPLVPAHDAIPYCRP